MNSIFKRIWCTFASIVLFGLIFSFVSFADDGQIYFTDPQSKAGGAVEITMTVQADGHSIGNVDVLLKYSPDSLEFKKGTNASGGAGTVRVHGSGVKEGDNKVNFTLTFKTPVAGEFTVNVDDYEVQNTTGAMINIARVGSSVVTVETSEGSIGASTLSTLEVTPGTLDPEFSSEITDYSVTVGLSVERLTINALSDDTTALVTVVNNESLKEGDNDVIVYVKNTDGNSQSEYHIHVLKTEGGEENLVNETVSEAAVEPANGVQLSCKGKTITIMDSETLEAPQGFRESQIRIDGQPVKGWIAGDDTDPQYFLVYGMNSEGELNFYRYDRIEKTIQRYFSDENVKDPTGSDEFIVLQEELSASNAKSKKLMLVLLIVCILAFLLLIIVIYLSIRLSSVCRELDQLRDSFSNGLERRRLDPAKSRRTRKPRDDDRYIDDEDEDDEDEDEDQDEDFHEPEEGDSYDDYTIVRRRRGNDNGETKVLPRSSRRRSSRKASSVIQETTVIRRASRRHDTDF